MSFILGQEFRTPLVDSSGLITVPWQKRFSRAVVLDAFGRDVATLNGQIVAGVAEAPPGGEPFSATGASAGFSMNDRTSSAHPRWVVFALSSIFRIYNGTDGECLELATEANTADTETCLLIRRNLGGTFSMQRVSMGASDSGGAGYRVLRVPN